MGTSRFSLLLVLILAVPCHSILIKRYVFKPALLSVGQIVALSDLSHSGVRSAHQPILLTRQLSYGNTDYAAISVSTRTIADNIDLITFVSGGNVLFVDETDVGGYFDEQIYAVRNFSTRRVINPFPADIGDDWAIRGSTP